MSDRKESFEVIGTPRVELYLNSGDVRFKQVSDEIVTLSMSGSAEAVDAIEVFATEGTITARTTAKRRRWFGGGSVDTIVSLPAGSDVLVHLGAGDVTANFDLGEAEVHVGSGDIRLETVTGRADLKVGSGDIRLSKAESICRVASAAGDCRLGMLTEVSISTGAGDLYLDDVSESATIKAAAGDVRVRRFSGTDLEIKTMSGDATIGLIPGLTVNANVKTMSGDLRNRIKPSGAEKVGTVNLTVVSFVGDVTLKTAK